MVLRLAALAALAVFSSACAYRTQSPARDVALDYSDYAQYDQSFGASPSRPAVAEGAMATKASDPSPARPAASKGKVTRDNALGLAADAGNASETITAEASDMEYEEVEATPGTACYDAAQKAGIVKGTCTLVSERRFLLVGEKAH